MICNNNQKSFESDIKGSTASSSSSPQNVAFVSENTNSTNEVSTAYCVPNLSGQNTKYEQTSSYSLLANQSSCPQLDHEDLEQIDEYDLEEMDLKWQVAMISMRMKKFYKKTGRKLQFDAKEAVGFDKTKVECYNCHKTGHFARECRIKGSQDNRRREAWNSGNKDGNRTGQKEDSKALVTVDGEGVDWTTHSEDEDYALMACNSSDSDTEVISCSNKCKESYANLKKLYDAQREQLSDASIEIKAYSQGLKKVEAQLVAHQQGQLWYEQKIKFMKIDLDDKTDVLTYHKKLLAEAQKEKEDLKAKVEKWQNSSKNLSKLLNTQMSANDKFGLGYGDHRYDGILSYENEVLQSVFMNKESDLENQPLNDRFADGMHAVPPPMTGNYMPTGPEIEIDYSQFTYGPKQTQPSESESQSSECDTCESNISTEPSELVSEPIVIESNVESQPKVWSDAPIIEEYESDSEDEYVSLPTKQQETPSFANQQVKTPRENVKSQNTHSQKPKVDKKDLGHGCAVRACFVCGSLNHLIRDCDFHEKRMARKAVLNNGWNNVHRVNKQNQFIPSAVLTRTGIIPVSTARASSTNNFSTARQSFNRQTVLTNTAMKVNTVKPIVNRLVLLGEKGKLLLSPQQVVVGDHKDTMVDPNTIVDPVLEIDYPHRALKNKGIVDSGCSRHMTGNKAYLAEFQDFNGGHVAFGGSKGYIIGKGKIKTRKLDFEDVCFVKELQHFNIFSVSQMCDKKNKVLFTDSECLVLSSEFKLPDENQVLLKIPRQNNMYSFNLENIAPTGGLAGLIAKATTDESNKWHRRLGHVNFKNLNKLVKGNLVRGLPSKIFQNDHTCVACQKGKQHKASCKAKAVSSISQTLQLLHMDLFGPTFYRDTKRIKSKDHRSDQWTLIEAARTMLADSFLPNTFWAEAVSTACYVLNRVLVTKPHNKTPYELLIGDSDKEDESAQDCFVLPIRPSYSSTNSPALTTDDKREGPREEEQVFMDDLERLKRQEKEAYEEAEALKKKFETLVIKEGAAKPSSTNIFSTVSTPAKASSTNPLNTVRIPVSTASPHKGLSLADPTHSEEGDSEIPPLEDIYQNSTDGIFTTSSFDDEGAVADFTNLETVVNVSHIPTSRIHSTHPRALILGDPTSAVQTRSKINTSSGAHAFVSYVQKQKRTNHKDFHHCLVPLVDLPYGKKAIGTKWVYRNKKDERGVVVRNKASTPSETSEAFSQGCGTRDVDVLSIGPLQDFPSNADTKFFRVPKGQTQTGSLEFVYFLAGDSFLAVQKATMLATSTSEANSCLLQLLESNPHCLPLSWKPTTHDEGCIYQERPSEALPTPSPAPTSEVPYETQTDSTPAQTKSSGENLGGHSSSDKSLSGYEGDMTIQGVYDLCLSLCKQVSAQAKEIQALKAQITKLKKQAKLVIKHHKAYLKSVSLKQRFPRKSFSKKHRVHKEYVSKQGRKFAKGESLVQRDPLFDEMPEDKIDHMETENAQSEGRTREMMDEDKESDEARLSTEDEVSTVKEGVSTDFEKLSTDRPIVSTDGSKVSTDRQIEGTDEQVEGTEEIFEGTEEQREGTEEKVESTDGQIQGTEDQTEDEIVTQPSKHPHKHPLISMILEMINKKLKPRPTSTRSLLTLKPLLKIDPKDKGKKKIEEEDESESKSDGIPQAEKKFKQLERDEELARKVQEEVEEEAERKQNRLLAEKLQEQEREQFTIEERLLAEKLQKEVILGVRYNIIGYKMSQEPCTHH
ncbi:ribonuclease H-like domain-containing protein [Tanacetum coccineum]